MHIFFSPSKATSSNCNKQSSIFCIPADFGYIQDMYSPIAFDESNFLASTCPATASCVCVMHEHHTQIMQHTHTHIAVTVALKPASYSLIEDNQTISSPPSHWSSAEFKHSRQYFLLCYIFSHPEDMSEAHSLILYRGRSLKIQNLNFLYLFVASSKKYISPKEFS